MARLNEYCDVIGEFETSLTVDDVGDDNGKDDKDDDDDDGGGDDDDDNNDDYNDDDDGNDEDDKDKDDSINQQVVGVSPQINTYPGQTDREIAVYI